MLIKELMMHLAHFINDYIDVRMFLMREHPPPPPRHSVSDRYRNKLTSITLHLFHT